jgi:hypothetical protein
VRELDPEAALFWVSAGAATGLPRRMRGYLVTPAPLAGRPAAFEVAGCRAYALAAGAGAARRAAA